MLVKNFELKGLPGLRKLVLIDPQMQDASWNLELPGLTELVMENHTPPVRNFARSLIQCPKIEEFFCHKFWHEENMPKLYLPSCLKFTFRRGDCTEALSLYLPRVEYLNFDACYDLERLTLLKTGHPEHAQWNPPKPTPQSQFAFSFENANLGDSVFKTLETSGRLLHNLDRKEEDDDDFDFCGGFGGFGPGSRCQMEQALRDMQLLGQQSGPAPTQTASEACENGGGARDDRNPLDAMMGRRAKVVSLNSRSDLVDAKSKAWRVAGWP